MANIFNRTISYSLMSAKIQRGKKNYKTLKHAIENILSQRNSSLCLENRVIIWGRASSLNVKMAWTHLKVIMIMAFIDSIALFTQNIHKITK